MVLLQTGRWTQAPWITIYWKYIIKTVRCFPSPRCSNAPFGTIWPETTGKTVTPPIWGGVLGRHERGRYGARVSASQGLGRAAEEENLGLWLRVRCGLLCKLHDGRLSAGGGHFGGHASHCLKRGDKNTDRDHTVTLFYHFNRLHFSASLFHHVPLPWEWITWRPDGDQNHAAA